MATIGRNDPCPCMSGKKFKKCCLPKMETLQHIEDQNFQEWFENDLALGQQNLKNLEEREKKG